jgi:hypothetical protein
VGCREQYGSGFASFCRIAASADSVMEKGMMTIRTIGLALLLAFTVSCSGSNKMVNPSISGAYEFVVTSNITGSVTLVEANMAASGNQSGASGPTQVQILTLEKKTWYVNGVCPGSTPGQNSVTINSGGNNIAVTFNEGGNALFAQAVQAGTTITGNYAITGSACPDLTGSAGTDSGGFLGNQVSPLAGTYSGVLNLPNGADDATLTLTENPDQTLNVSAALTGAVDNGTFPLTGSAVGNIMFVSGQVSGQNVSLFGYFDRAGAYTGMPNSILVFNYDTLSESGLLLGQ